MVAFNLTIYNWLKFVHVLAAVLWVGAGLYFQYQATRLNRAGDAARMAAFTHDVEVAGKQVLLPASGVVLLAGIAMVFYAPFLGFTDTWIALGLVGYVITALTGSLVLGPTAGKLSKAIAEEGPDAPSVQTLRSRIFAVSRVDQVVLIVVIALMVFKPGA